MTRRSIQLAASGSTKPVQIVQAAQSLRSVQVVQAIDTVQKFTVHANRHFLPGHVWHIAHVCSAQFQSFKSFNRFPSTRFAALRTGAPFKPLS
jgi:hypothetical protein